MGLDAMNQFWKKLASEDIDIDVGTAFDKRIAEFWIAYHRDIDPTQPPQDVPKTYELRKLRIQRKLLFRSKGQFFCRTKTELTYVAVPQSVPLS